MEKKYMKPAIRVQEMMAENDLNVGTADPTKIPISEETESPENADSKRVDWIDYLDD